MKTLKLKALDRIVWIGVLDGEGKKPQSLSSINKLLKIVDKISFNEAEAKLLNVRTENGAVRWNYTKDGLPDGEVVDIERDVELSDEQAEMLKEIVKTKDESKDFTLEGIRSIMNVAEQLGYEIK